MDHRIGQGQLPAGLIANCRAPKITKHLAGGNDQLQRGCRLGGISKGIMVLLLPTPLVLQWLLLLELTRLPLL